MKSRSLRRHHAERIKEKFRRVARKIWNLGWNHTKKNEPPKSPVPPKQEDPRVVGIAASTHCVGCSCYMCGNPRKYFGEITIQEKIADINEKEQLEDVKKQ